MSGAPRTARLRIASAVSAALSHSRIASSWGSRRWSRRRSRPASYGIRDDARVESPISVTRRL